MTARPRPGTASLLAAAAVVAAVTLLAGHTSRFDPQGWLLWGRELLEHGTFDTSGYPSWKPLALLLATPVAATGSAATVVWLWVIRTAGVLALLLLGRLAWARAGTVGAATAVALLALAPGWWPVTLGGGIEPVIVVLGCAAVVAHERGRYGLALALLAAMALGREEALGIVAGYGFVMRRRAPVLLPCAAGACVAVLAAWVGGDWLGSGEAFRGAALARTAVPENPFTRFTAVESAVGALVIPAGLALAVAGVRAARGAGDGVVAGIAAAGLAWACADVVLLAMGYPVPARFLIPASAAGALAAALGALAATGALGVARGRLTAVAPAARRTRR